MMNLKKEIIKTPLGSVLVIADDVALYLLEFLDYPKLDLVMKQLQKEIPQEKKYTITTGYTQQIESIEKELSLYFQKKLESFKTPLHFIGTPFQKCVWEELSKIPMGKTCSYASLAAAIGKPTAIRAAASANGANRFVIAVPCHRVINTNGKLGGYSSGLVRKEWLLNHEKI